jgi:phosphate transport system permease protein
MTTTAPDLIPMAPIAPLRARRRLGDRAFRALVVGAGVAVLVILALVALVMTRASIPWFEEWGWRSIFGTDWVPSSGANASLEALALIYGSVLTAAIAMLVAVPLSLGIALFVTEVAPAMLRKPVVLVIDLLAVVPSVVFGLWGLNVLAQPLSGVYQSVSDATNGVPVLGSVLTGDPVSGISFMTAGLILALMATPIIASLAREVLATTPRGLKEGALALGATRWEMVRGAVFPHARGGLVAASMIGLGRALGETIAVVLLVGASARITPGVFSSGETMAAAIARNFNEATGTTRSALIGLGLVLFVITLAINIAARSIVRRIQRRSAGA